METLKDKFRESMSRLASGVSVVTTELDGRPWGLTISACCSISMEPPLIMISLATNTASTKSIKDQGKFGVSILGHNQIDIARAGSKPGAPKYFEDFISPNEKNKSYVVKNALSHINCSVHETIIAGDHTIFIGSVKEVIQGDKRAPLLYFDRQFGTFDSTAITAKS